MEHIAKLHVQRHQTESFRKKTVSERAREFDLLKDTAVPYSLEEDYSRRQDVFEKLATSADVGWNITPPLKEISLFFWKALANKSTSCFKNCEYLTISPGKFL